MTTPDGISLRPPSDAGVEPIADPSSLDVVPDGTLDAAAYGVIVLDSQGVIRRYNLAEARLARLDRATVIEQSFFSRIAPCTATPEFEGRFRRYVAERRTDVERFEYVFDFRFGAQVVDVELVRGTTDDRWVLCINRRKFESVRPDAVAPAPRQSELAPGESGLGVRRDDDAQRFVQVPAEFFRAMRTTWDRVAPRGWTLFTGEWGVMWGRTLVVDLEAAMLRERNTSLRDEPMREVIGALRDRLLDEGWGSLEVDLSLARTEGLVLAQLARSAVAESVGHSPLPRCQLVAGVLTAFFSHLAQRVVTVREVSCLAQGHGECSFVMSDASRRAKLESAIEQSGHDVQRTLELLRST